MCACVEYVLPPEPQYKIQCNYTYLLRELDTSALLDRLFNDCVLNEDERMEVDELQVQSKRCAKLLSLVRRKTQKQYEIFVEALVATNQSHVADVLRLEGLFSILW